MDICLCCQRCRLSRSSYHQLVKYIEQCSYIRVIRQPKFWSNRAQAVFNREMKSSVGGKSSEGCLLSYRIIL